MATNKNEYITFLQSFGVSIVVFGHGFSLDALPLFIKWIKAWISGYHMPLFFFISGYLFVYANPHIQTIEIKSFIYKKIKRILLPYLILTSFAFIPKVLLSKYAYNKIEFNIGTFISGFFYSSMNPIAYFWFLPTIFMVYIIALGLYRHIYHASLANYMIILPFLLYLNVYNPISNIKFLNLNNVSLYFIFFGFGSMYFIYEEWLNRFIENPLAFPVLLSITIILTYFSYGDYSTGKRFLVKAIFGILMSVSLSKLYINNKYYIFKLIDGYYYQIFLLSWFFITFCRIIFYHKIGLSPFAACTVMFFSGLLLPVFVAKVINKRMRFMKFTIGM